MNVYFVLTAFIFERYIATLFYFFIHVNMYIQYMYIVGKI